MRLLGIDFGTKKIGLALSDKSGKFAFPLVTITSKLDFDMIGKIKEICQQNQVAKIVLGWPEGYKSDTNKILREIEEFKAKLEKATALPVVYENEVLTTKQIQRALAGSVARGEIASGKKKAPDYRGRASVVGKIDAAAAALILQTYLDRSGQDSVK
jgi:putative Holliday junction resolvase